MALIDPLFNNEGHWILASFFMRFSGTLSLVGSAMIIYMIISDRIVKLKRIHNRFLLGLSVLEIFSSSAWIMSVSVAPKDSPGSYGAMGNQATCTLQGFFFQLGLGTPFYSFSLCLYHCLVIRFNITDAIISKRLEPWLHAVSILFPLATALAGIPMEMYNFKGAICYIEPSPWGCRYDQTCTRNPRSLVFEFWFAGFWLILIICSVVVLMTLVYFSVRHRERSMSKFNFRTRNGIVILSSSYVQLCNDKRETGIQAFLYVSALIITFIWVGINYFLTVANPGPQPQGKWKLLIFLFQPLQGFWNFFIYIRPRYCVISTQYPDKSCWEKLILVIFYPDRGRRNISRVGSARRIHTNTASTLMDTSKLSLINVLSGKTSEEISASSSEEISATPYNHGRANLKQEESHSAFINYTGGVSVSHSGFSNDMNSLKSPIPTSIEPSYSATQSHPSNYRQGENLESISVGDHSLQRRRSLISISLDDIDTILVDDNNHLREDYT